jgi:integral membrane protein
MAHMANNYDVRSVAGWFRLIAIAEALSWAGLLVGMYFKYAATPQTEIGVKIFGPIHGGVFMAFLAAALLVGISRKWNIVTWVLALLGSIVPLGSVIFVMWADRTGKLSRATVTAARGDDVPNLVA